MRFYLNLYLRMTNNSWLKYFASSPFPIISDNGIIKIAVGIDKSREALEYLKGLGYTHVKWIKSHDPCPTCQALHGATWSIDNFIDSLQHDAPIYEKSHCGCRCFVSVFNPKKDSKLEPVVIEAV